MPFRRRTFRRRSRKPKSSTRAIALKALRSTDQEVKFHDLFVNVAVVNTGNNQTMNLLASGTDTDERIGDTVRLVSLHLKVSLQIDAFAANSLCRMIVYYDKQPNGAPTAVADLLQDPANSPRVVLSHKQMSSLRRITVLRDHLFNFTAINSQRSRNVFIKLSQKPRYSGPLNIIADLESGALGVLFISDQVAQPVALQYQARLRFVG